MAGAFTGLADDYFGTLDNPAGLAVNLSGITLAISSANIDDNQHTDRGTSYRYYTSGLAVPLGGMGASVGSSTPFGAISPTGEKIELSEYRVSFAKAFLKNTFSVGLGVAPTSLSVLGDKITRVRFTLGSLYRFPRRIFLGLTATPATTFGPDSTGRTFSTPTQASFGSSWIPNRSFRVSAGIRWLAPEGEETRRFHSPTQIVGQGSAFQTHLGLDYLFLHFRQIHCRLFTGTYRESLRSDEGSRIHFTGGLEVNPWFLRFSGGVDTSSNYQNLAVGVGVDIGSVLRLLKLYPPEVQAPAAGLLPNPFEVSDDWLPPEIQDDPEHAFQTIGPDLQDLPETLEKLPGTLLK